MRRSRGPPSRYLHRGGFWWLKTIMGYKITYFDNASQSIMDKAFKGVNAFQNAIEWGQQTLENFNLDLIQPL